MKDRRLVVFGCSNTYGVGLESAEVNPEHPCQLGWPYKLAKLLNIDLVENQAIPGNSNKKIYSQILEFPFESTDLCVVHWSYVGRHCVFRENKLDLTFLPNMQSYRSLYAMHYYRNLYDEYDGTVEYAMQSTGGYSYLETIGIRHYHMHSMENSYTHQTKKFQQCCKAKFVEETGIPFYRDTDRLALDGIHAGEHAHETTARDLAKLIIA